MEEYKLSYKAEDINERLRKAGVALLEYYSTKREEIGVSHEDINTAYILGLYDALMAAHPGKVEKHIAYDDGIFINYYYVISTGGYNAEGAYDEMGESNDPAFEMYEADDHTKKPKYLILSAVHGSERKTALSTYRFIRDVLSGHNVPQAFKEGVVLSVMPVGNPSGFDAFTYETADGVNINRDFISDAAVETQAIKKWLTDNEDADLFLDFHNSAFINEVVMIFGNSGSDLGDTAKKIALRGVDRVIPFWRDVIGYPSVETLLPDGTTGEKAVVFSYSADANVEVSAIYYAQNALGIPSLAIETSAYYGNYSDWQNNLEAYPSETIAAGAEALGNILIEFYKEAFFGEVSNGMKEIDSKLDSLMERVNSGFHVVRGELVVADDQTGGVDVKIPCPSGAKTVEFYADADTMAAIKSSQGIGYIGTYLGNFYAPNIANITKSQLSYISMMQENDYYASQGVNGGWVLLDGSTGTQSNEDGVTFKCAAIKAGRYEWVAYYWND